MSSCSEDAAQPVLVFPPANLVLEPLKLVRWLEELKWRLCRHDSETAMLHTAQHHLTCRIKNCSPAGPAISLRTSFGSGRIDIVRGPDSTSSAPSAKLRPNDFFAMIVMETRVVKRDPQ